MTRSVAADAVRTVDDELLRSWPLPTPPPDGDKEQRGSILVVAGSPEMPGAVILAATAALRAGAGKLTIGTAAGVAQLVALAVPEARVIALPEARGGISTAAAGLLAPIAGEFDAALLGPGMRDEPQVRAFVLALLPSLASAQVVLDAGAMGVVALRSDWRFACAACLTPHAGEMAHLSGTDKEAVQAEPRGSAQAAARRWNAVVALKGAISFVAAPHGKVWRHVGGNVGLAISGSGDVLSGIIGGLAARGAPLEQACTWGIALHARAGERLARRGELGYLAREIAGEVPALMQALRAH